MDVKISKAPALVMIIFSLITAAVSLSVSYNDRQEEIVCYRTTSDGTRIARYEWTIKNLNFSDFVQNQPLNSTTFSSWYLSLYPKGHWDADDIYMSLFIYPPSANVSANVRVGLLNARKEEINTKHFNHYFSEMGWGYLRFVQRDFVLNAQNGLFVNNTLTIFCEIKTNISESQDLLEKTEQLPLKDDVGTDLAVLLDNELFSDVIISAGGKNFSAHKAVLAARCPFFKNMFQYDMEVKNTSWVNMTNVDNKVMREMLRYIYTGKVLNLEDLATSLLAEAERFEWVRLKANCERSISSKLSIENAVEYYKLGDTYSAVYLKDRAKDFIVAHAADVIATSEFKSLPQTHPLLLEELLPAIVKGLPTH